MCMVANTLILLISLSLSFDSNNNERLSDRIKTGQSFEIPCIGIQMMPIRPPDAEVYWLSEKEVTFREFLIYLNDSGKDGDVYFSGGTLDPYVKSGDRYELRKPALSLWNSDDKPAVSVTWLGAQNFCKWLNESFEGKIPAGYRFRLPTVEEWKFACRLGKSDSISANVGGDPSYVALIKGSGFTVPVGSYPPNEFGLYDMHGNVMEWSSSIDTDIDIFGRGADQRSEQRYACGTSFFSPNDVNACDGLSSLVTSFGTEYIGFRLAFVLDK